MTRNKKRARLVGTRRESARIATHVLVVKSMRIARGNATRNEGRDIHLWVGVNAAVADSVADTDQ